MMNIVAQRPAFWQQQLRKDRSMARRFLVDAPGFGIGDVGEPFELGRDVGEVAELSRRETDADFQRRAVAETA